MSTLGERMLARMFDLGIRDLVHVANGEGFGLYKAFHAHEECRVIDSCREGEAVALSCGLFLGGRFPVLSMENFGVFECLDTMRAFPIALKIPMIIVVGYTFRTAMTKEDGGAIMARLKNLGPHAMIAAEWTEPVLDCVEIPHWFMAPNDDAARIDEIYNAAIASGRPVAVLVDVTT